MTDTRLDGVDAAELADLLQLLVEVFTFHHEQLDAALAHVIGHPAYGAHELRADLNRFIFLLGGNDGEPLFHPDHRHP